MITFQEEFAKVVIEEGASLFEAHWKEIAVNQEKVPLDPDYDKYYLLEDMGVLHVVTARDNGTLVGYFVSIIETGLHYKQNVFAINDILFIHPDYRKGSVGIKLIKFTEQCLKDRGIDVLVMRHKAAHDFSRILERLGMTHTESVYMKYIGE